MVRPYLGLIYLLYTIAFLAIAPTSEGVLQDRCRALATNGLAYWWTDGSNALGGEYVPTLYDSRLAGDCCQTIGNGGTA